MPLKNQVGYLWVSNVGQDQFNSYFSLVLHVNIFQNRKLCGFC